MKEMASGLTYFSPFFCNFTKINDEIERCNSWFYDDE
jgi:hypothetical protein